MAKNEGSAKVHKVKIVLAKSDIPEGDSKLSIVRKNEDEKRYNHIADLKPAHLPTWVGFVVNGGENAAFVYVPKTTIEGDFVNQYFYAMVQGLIVRAQALLKAALSGKGSKTTTTADNAVSVDDLL